VAAVLIKALLSPGRCYGIESLPAATIGEVDDALLAPDQGLAASRVSR
jgi:hypothetical protein